MNQQHKWRTLLRSINLFKQKGCSTKGACCKQTTQRSSIRRSFSDAWHPKEVENPKLLRPFLFTIGVSTASFTISTIVQYERARNKSIVSDYWEHFKHGRREKEFEMREYVKKWWDSLDEGRKMAAVLIGVNILVFGGWQLRACQPFMCRWFLTSPTRSSPMLLSCFSHKGLMHLGANMYVLWSFAPHIHRSMGSEQLAAFYVSGGCVSSLASHYFKVATGVMIPSLGASGALLAVLAACCLTEPDARLSILFLPFFTFSAQSALTGLIVLDTCGLLFRWMLFDHAAHLGGTLFGSWYVCYGHKYTWDQRAPLTRSWHQLRKYLENGR